MNTPNAKALAFAMILAAGFTNVTHAEPLTAAAAAAAAKAAGAAIGVGVVRNIEVRCHTKMELVTVASIFGKKMKAHLPVTRCK